jgi:glutathione synthase/RimK-type ligase-like ATP-grasp enzyme
MPGWFVDDDKRREIFTLPVSADDLPSDQLLTVAPGIYQEKLEKKRELRIVALGDRLLCLSIDASQHRFGRFDWRAAPQAAVLFARCEVPQELVTPIQRYLQTAELRFACFDFIHTPDDRYVFLEANQSGQFLWMDAVCPELEILNGMLKFLTGSQILRSFDYVDIKQKLSRYG